MDSLVDRVRAYQEASQAYTAAPTPDGYRQVLSAEHAIAELVTGAIGRQEYEAQCRQAGIEPLSDAQVASLAMDFEDMALPGWDIYETHPGHWYKCRLAVMRARGLRQERPPVVASAARPLFRCAVCDRSAPQTVAMTSARGTVCPDCYDEASEVW